MLASLAGYNLLNNMNKHVYILVVKPRKYFTKQDIQANIFKFMLTGNVIFGFLKWVISVIKKCQCILSISNKKAYYKNAKKYRSYVHFFLMCSVLY